MFTLLSGLWRYLFQKDEYFVLILGLDNAGKSTYLEQTKTQFCSNYKGISLNKITTTVGLNIGKIDIGNVCLNFWDLGGQEELQSLWDKYYAESHAVIYMVDTSDMDRLDESLTAFEEMIIHESLDNVPLLMLGNKQDLDNCMTIPAMKKHFKRVAHKIGHRHCTVMGTSALKGSGVQEGIDWIVQCVQQNSMNRPPTQKDIS